MQRGNGQMTVHGSLEINNCALGGGRTHTWRIFVVLPQPVRREDSAVKTATRRSFLL
jgi:hypothetical protein